MSYNEYLEDGTIITHPNEYVLSKKEDYLALFEICRKKMKISLEGIGKVIGVNKTTVSKIFRGKLGLSADKLIKLLDFFDYELIASELIGGDDYAMSMTVQDYEKDLERWELQNEITEKYKEEEKK
ncbi:MAG: helix-turn-helix transcriptional regulator [Candidatus Eremiobacterota bacterium]